MTRLLSRRMPYRVALLFWALSSARTQGLLDLDGHAVHFSPSAQQRPAVLIFVRTDCPISNRYAPEIKRLQALYGQRASFKLVYAGKSQSVRAVKQHLHQFGFTAPALRDTEEELVKLAKIDVTPEAAVFDTSGDLLYHGRIDNLYAGIGRARPAATTHELDDAIQAALKGEKPLVTTVPAVGCSVADLQ